MFMLKTMFLKNMCQNKIVWSKNVTSFYLPVIGKSFKLLNFVSIKITKWGENS